ncbi:MAG: hypothetical protein F4X92_10195 [Gammaproteobacteria bacterium]|nr:hypothetical protein [Gammaproteobacteria bacterium]
MRKPAITAFPTPPSPPEDIPIYLSLVDNIYQSDTYHSLSIEGCRVTPGLIYRVRSGNWNPDKLDTDRKSSDALAARGYWQSFQMARKSIREILHGANAGALVRKDHNKWYRELFLPCVMAGLIEATDLVEYRNHAVYIQESRHVPPRREAIRDAMLASGGYPWTVIRVEDRDLYMTALEKASIDQDIVPFAQFVAKRLGWLLMEEIATPDHRPRFAKLESHGNYRHISLELIHKISGQGCG